MEGPEVSWRALRFHGGSRDFREGPEISGEPSEISEEPSEVSWRVLRFQGGF